VRGEFRHHVEITGGERRKGKEGRPVARSNKGEGEASAAASSCLLLATQVVMCCAHEKRHEEAVVVDGEQPSILLPVRLFLD